MRVPGGIGLRLHRALAARPGLRCFEERVRFTEIQKKLARRDNYGGKRQLGDIAYLVVHYTGGNGDTAAENATYFSRDFTGTSAHYFVDEREVWQSVPDDHTAWHCGTKGAYYHPSCRNRNSIGMELCSRESSGGYFFPSETRARAVRLAKQLMHKYGIPIQNVVRHYDVTHKCCPAPFVQESYAWSQFRAELEREEDETLTIYHKMEDVPAWGKEAVQHLLDKGWLAGDGEGDLDLEHYMLRTLVIGFRAGVFK